MNVITKKRKEKISYSNSRKKKITIHIPLKKKKITSISSILEGVARVDGIK